MPMHFPFTGGCSTLPFSALPFQISGWNTIFLKKRMF
jgi:hypothetical protein